MNNYEFYFSEFMYNDFQSWKKENGQTQKDQFPVIQEGDHGLIIIRQRSLDWRERAIQDIEAQLRIRQKELGCLLTASAQILADDSLLIEWKRERCEGIPGGPK